MTDEKYRLDVQYRCPCFCIGGRQGDTIASQLNQQGRERVTQDDPAGQSHGALASTMAIFVGSRLGNLGRSSGIRSRSGDNELSWAQLLWPACQQGLSRLICKFSKGPLRCEALTQVTRGFRGTRVPGRLLFALGVAGDAHQLSKAIGRSVRAGNARPAAAQATRTLTTWGAVWAGAELFGTGGALLGIETGPGAVVTSGVGALMGGFIGMFASDWLARRIDLTN